MFKRLRAKKHFINHVKKKKRQRSPVISFKSKLEQNSTAERQYVKKKQHLVCTKIPVQTNKNGNILKQKKKKHDKMREDNRRKY